MGKHHDDINDLDFIIKDIHRFASMKYEDYMSHYKEHPEDRMQLIAWPGGGHHPISREATRRFTQLTNRQWKVMPNKHAIDPDTLDCAIRDAFIEVFMLETHTVERKWVDRMLNRAVQKVTKNHEATTHYLPCVIMKEGHPPDFCVGPVKFITTEQFFADYQGRIESDLKATSKRQRATLKQMIAEGKHSNDRMISDKEAAHINQMVLANINEYYKGFVWVAEVAVPACDVKVSRERAEKTVQAALDILKLFYGYSGGKDFRLAHNRGLPEKTADLKRRSDGSFHWAIGGYGEGAFVKEGWYDHIVQNSGLEFQLAGSAIEGYLNPEIKSDYRDRWLDALNWYGQAVSETLPSAQLVKYVAALERLTVTEHSPKDKATATVTRRTALLTFGNINDICTAVKNARTLYKWRSKLMHGQSSPLTKKILPIMRLADNTTQDALFSALEVYYGLEMERKTTSKKLEMFFVDLEKNLHTKD